MAKVWIGAHTSNFAQGRPGGWRPEAIVIHVMDGTLAGTGAWFNNSASRVSAHYGIGKDGVVHQYVKESDTAFHAGVVSNPKWETIKKSGPDRFINPNFYTIGIEHAGWGDKADAWPQAQRDASLDLVREIAARWGIAINANTVIPHASIRSGKPNCPGKGVNFSSYLVDLGNQAPNLMSFVERPFNDGVRALMTLNVRRQPSTLSMSSRKLLTGEAFLPVAVATGETHAGIDQWYRIGASEYVWAGGTDRPLTA